MVAVAKQGHKQKLPRASQQRFLAMLPVIRCFARRAFRYLNKEAKEDAVTEVVASAFVAFSALCRRGKEDLAYPTVLARFAVAQFHAGRRVGHRQNSCDVLAVSAQRRYGFSIERIRWRAEPDGEWVHAIIEDDRTPILDQVAFRCDFPAWLAIQKPRDRRIAEALAVGDSPGDVARRFHLTPGRISQLRCEFHNSWHKFHGEQGTGDRGRTEYN